MHRFIREHIVGLWTRMIIKYPQQEITIHLKYSPLGLSELMRMIIIFVTFCLNNKKKIPQGLRGKKYTNQFSLQSKGAVTVEDYWTECQYYDIG